MNRTFYLLALCILSFPFQSFSGARSGAGGDAYVCFKTEKKEKVHSARFWDLLEWEALNGELIQGKTTNENDEDYIERHFERLIFKFRQTKLLENILTLKLLVKRAYRDEGLSVGGLKALSFINKPGTHEVEFGTGTTDVPDMQDDGNRIFPQPNTKCQYLPIAMTSKVHQIGRPVILIDHRYYKYLPLADKVAVLTHELLLFMYFNKRFPENFGDTLWEDFLRKMNFSASFEGVQSFENDHGANTRGLRNFVSAWLSGRIDLLQGELLRDFLVANGFLNELSQNVYLSQMSNQSWHFPYEVYSSFLSEGSNILLIADGEISRWTLTTYVRNKIFIEPLTHFFKNFRKNNYVSNQLLFTKEQLTGFYISNQESFEIDLLNSSKQVRLALYPNSFSILAPDKSTPHYPYELDDSCGAVYRADQYIGDKRLQMSCLKSVLKLRKPINLRMNENALTALSGSKLTILKTSTQQNYISQIIVQGLYESQGQHFVKVSEASCSQLFLSEANMALAIQQVYCPKIEKPEIFYKKKYLDF